jgi:hypothetical protein
MKLDSIADLLQPGRTGEFCYAIPVQQHGRRAIANLTLRIPDEDLKRARIRAIEEGTSVNEVVRKWIKEYGEREDRIRAAMDRVLEASARYHGRIKGGRFDRAEVYEPGRGRAK